MFTPLCVCYHTDNKHRVFILIIHEGYMKGGGVDNNNSC